MNVSLARELEAMVNEKLQSGHYNSPSEVVNEALRLLRNHDELRRIRLEELRRDVQVGIDQADRGEVVPKDWAAFNADRGARRAGQKTGAACEPING